MSHFREKLQADGQLLKPYAVAVRPAAIPLFFRHLRARLREFAFFTTGFDIERSHEECWLANDVAGTGVPFYVGCELDRNKPLGTVWTSISMNGQFPGISAGRAPRQGELVALRSRLAEAIRKAESLANAGHLRTFTVGFRIDGQQLAYPHKPILFGTECVMTLPPRTDAELTSSPNEFANNPAVGWLFECSGTDVEDARIGCRDELYRRVLFWALLSACYCRATGSVYSAPGHVEQSLRRFKQLRMSETRAKAHQGYSRPKSKSMLRKLNRMWQTFESVDSNVLAAAAAYHSALQVRSRTFNLSSPAVVSYIAALESLMPRPRKCSGRLTCDVCGCVREGHSCESHQSAIVSGLRDLLTRTHAATAKRLIAIAYSRIRSPYVHGAQSIVQEHRFPMLLGRDWYDDEAFWGRQVDIHTLLNNLDELVRTVLVRRAMGIPYVPDFYVFESTATIGLTSDS